MHTRLEPIAALCALLAGATPTVAAEFEPELTAVIREYDDARFDSRTEQARIKSLQAVLLRADALARKHPSRGEPLIWKGQVEAELSAAERSLGLAKQARKTLEAAIAMQQNEHSVEAYATLGSMYSNVPGFPLAFGDKKKARSYLLKGIDANAASLRANLSLAQFLFKEEDYAGTVRHASAALAAPPRRGRDNADSAGKASAKELLAKAQAKLR